MQQKEYIGFNSIENLKNILKELNASKIFLVTGKNSYESSGAREAIENLTLNYLKYRFYDFEKNPNIQDVKKGIKVFNEEEFDTVLAIGGGSVIDMAKLINILSPQPKRPEKYIRKETTLSERGKPLISVPTTAGSGSEATHFAVIYIDKKKYSLAHEYILPSVSIIDPSFTMSSPHKLTASAGMDALCQAIESYWCVNSTEESKKFSKAAIKLIMNNYVETILEPTSQSRFSLIKAAHLAGKAINITKTTAAHAISYPLTSYFDVPHGQAVGLTLGEILIYNGNVTDRDLLDPRGVMYVRQTINEVVQMLGATDLMTSKSYFSQLMQKVGLETSLSELGIQREEEIELILNNINLERLVNNPRSFTEASLKQILLNIF